MSRTRKAMAVLVGAALIVVCGTGIMVAGTAVAGGVMTVSIHEEGPDGMDLFIPVPAGLVDVALAMAPTVIQLADHHHDLEADLRHLRADFGELLPVLEAVIEGVSDMPDAVLVEVDGGFDDYVRVSKEGRSLQILVREDGNRISISVPLRVFRSVSGFLQG